MLAANDEHAMHGVLKALDELLPQPATTSINGTPAGRVSLDIDVTFSPLPR